MQTKGSPTQRLLASQQAIMKALGFYDGAIDGSWGPKCVTAMREWSMEESFDPALPTRGYPLSPPSRLPKGLVWKPGKVQDISWALMPTDVRAKIDEAMATFAPTSSSDIDGQLDPKPAAHAPVPVEQAPATQQVQQNQNRNVQNGNVHGKK